MKVCFLIKMITFGYFSETLASLKSRDVRGKAKSKKQ